LAAETAWADFDPEEPDDPVPLLEPVLEELDVDGTRLDNVELIEMS
jgi:hypothetical protein